MDELYPYIDVGHHSIAIRRQAIVYDPYSVTDNEQIRILLTDLWEDNESAYTLAQLLESEYAVMGHSIESLPISELMMLKRTQLMWINLIIHMVLKEKMFDLFAEEFGGIMLEIDENSTIFHKESAVYRDLVTGESIFENAARIFIMTQKTHHPEKVRDRARARSFLFNQYAQVCDSYKQLGEKVRDESLILGVKNFNGIRMEDSLLSFTKSQIGEAE